VRSFSDLSSAIPNRIDSKDESYIVRENILPLTLIIDAISVWIQSVSLVSPMILARSMESAPP
jgi:hypothetical protein